MQVKPRIDRRFDITARGVPGQRDCDDPLARIERTQLTHQRVAVLLGHPYVRHQHVEAGVGREQVFERCSRGIADRDIRSREPQRLRDNCAGIGLVVHHQNRKTVELARRARPRDLAVSRRQ